MNITIETKVNNKIKNIWEGFNEALFNKLAPPFPKSKLLRFDGSHTGDIIQIELDLILIKTLWESIITEHVISDEEIYFIDEGKKLPFFLKSWKHKHIIVSAGENAKIIDEIVFKTPFWLTDYIFYPILYLQFYYRVPIYQKIFNKQS